MSAAKLFRVAFVFSTVVSCLLPSAAHGGPLLDWLRGKRPCATPQSPMMACGIQPGQCQVTCQQTCSRVVVNYVPYTAYRTAWEQVPVTQYKPVTNTDPCTGCTVTCMKPCTSYSWQMKQVPYTTYRPVYRTENYSVPVTYTTPANPCIGCQVPATTSNCNTCGVPGSGPVYYDPSAASPSVMAPQGTLNTNGSYGTIPAGSYYPAPYSGTPTPADLPPAINSVNPQSMQRPVLEQLHGMPGAVHPTAPRIQVPVHQPAPPPQQAVPAVLHNLTVDAAPIRQPWEYTPVRLASYTTAAVPASQPEDVAAPHVYRATPVAQPSVTAPSNPNAAWSNVGW